MVRNNDDDSTSNREQNISGLATSEAEEVAEEIREQMEERGIDPSSLKEAITTNEEQNDVDRDRGIITPEDRRFLLGEKEYNHETTLLNTKRRIRDRVKNGILDLTYILLMDADELVKVFDSIPDNDLYFSLSEFMSIIYKGLDSNEDELENIIESGVYYAEQEKETGTKIQEVDVFVKLKRAPDIDKIREKYSNGIELTNSEIGLLIRKKGLSQSEIKELCR